MFDNLKDSTRLMLGFAGVTVLGVAMALVATFEMEGMARAIESVTHDRMPKMETAQRVMDDLDAAGRYARTLLLLPDAAARAVQKQRIAEAQADTDDALAELDKVLVAPDARAAHHAIVG